MEEEQCNTGLGLGIGGSEAEFIPNRRRGQVRKLPVQFHILFPPLMKEEEGEGEGEEEEEPTKQVQGVDMRLRFNTDDKGEGVTFKDTSDIGNNKVGGARKKLRLTKEQSTLLEDSFREHSTLNPTQKQELSNRLSLRPRQVEVWFQNRRARTKLKQTEVDCEFLKKCCESLSDENRRLKKELQELRSVKPGSPFYIQLPKAATLTMCPSCERIATNDGAKNGAMAMDAVPTNKPKFYASAIKDSSYAC